MKILIYIFLTLTTGAACSAYSLENKKNLEKSPQVGDFEQEMESQVLAVSDPEPVIILKGRKLLQKKILNGDVKATQKVMNYLIGYVENEDYIALYPVERLLLYYWISDFRQLLGYFQLLENGDIDNNAKITPYNDTLFKTLINQIQEDHEKITQKISSAENINGEEKDFLIIMLDFNIYKRDQNSISWKSITEKSRIFLKDYPLSNYSDFIRNNIYTEYKVTNNNSVGFGIFAGYGLFTGNLTRFFKGNYPFGITFNIYSENLAFFFRAYGSVTSTETEITRNGTTWPVGSSMDLSMTEASLGYQLYKNSHFRFTPWLGISYATFLTWHEKSSTLKMPLNGAFTMSAGFDLSLFLGKKKKDISTRPSSVIPILTIRYGYYRPRFDTISPAYTGDMHTIQLELSYQFREVAQIR